MSLFVHYDNQTILWETIQQHPYVTMIPPAQRASWFKQHIQTIYEKAPASWFAPPMTTEKLNHVNQQTMQYMVNDLKMMASSSPSDMGGGQQRPNNNRGAQIQSFDLHLGEGPSRPPPDRRQGGNSEEFKDKSLYDQFLQKQQDIESMLQNKQVNPIDFKMSELDAPITNIDELIQRQLRDRELDVMTPPIHQYIGAQPAPPPHPPSIIHSSKSITDVPKPLKIDSNDEEVLDLNVQEIKHVEFKLHDSSLEERLKQLEERMEQQWEHLNKTDERIQVLEKIQKQYLEQVQKSDLFENPKDLVGLILGLEEEDQEETETSISIEENEP
jgi:hypothetical protein